MATPVIMPRQGQSVESCLMAKWHRKKGDSVKTGDLLFTYETDKAVFDEEAKSDGVILDIFFLEGDDVPCLANVCVIGSQGEDTAQYNPNISADKKEDTEDIKEDIQEDIKDGQVPGQSLLTRSEGAAVQSQMPVVLTHDDEKVKISPRAKNTAQKAGIDYRHAHPTGPDGRIIERDIEEIRISGRLMTQAAMDELMKLPAYFMTGTGLGGRITVADLETGSDVSTALTVKDAAQAEQQKADSERIDFEEVRLTNIRKIIAKTMHQSLSSAAQLTLNASFDATDILEYRKKLKKAEDTLNIGNITINDMLLYAVSRALPDHRDLNAHFMDDRLLCFNNVHLGVAIDTPRGLTVPVVYNANRKSLYEISAEVKKLADECRKGTLNPDLTKGGSFTVTNLGSLGIESFTPVLNPPQTGILGVNNITQRVRERNGKLESYPVMTLSLTFDHRAVDGAPAAKLLQQLTRDLENFSLLLVK